MVKKWHLAQEELKKVRASDIAEEVLIAEDPEVQAMQGELPDVWLEEWWWEVGRVRRTQLGEIPDDTIVPLEDLEKRQMQRALGNKTITFTDEDDSPREMWDEKYFEE